MFLGKVVLKVCSKFTGEHPCLSVISIKLLCNFIGITLQHGSSPENSQHIFRTPLLLFFTIITVNIDVSKPLQESAAMCFVFFVFNMLSTSNESYNKNVKSNSMIRNREHFLSIEETILRNLVNVPERNIICKRQECLSNTTHKVRISYSTNISKGPFQGLSQFLATENILNMIIMFFISP